MIIDVINEQTETDQQKTEESAVTLGMQEEDSFD